MYKGTIDSERCKKDGLCIMTSKTDHINWWVNGNNGIKLIRSENE